MENFIEKILEYSVSLAILIIVFYYFARKNDEKDKKIDKMHKEFVGLIKENNEKIQKSCQEMMKKLENFSKK